MPGSATMSEALAYARLLADVWSLKIFVWMLGRNGELLDSHLFFFDRYSELADHHRRKGRIAKADRLTAIAEAHYQTAPGDDDQPPAAAMAMPVPQPPTNTNAVGTRRVQGQSAGGSSLAPRLAGSHVLDIVS
jgi:hypothetical protein